MQFMRQFYEVAYFLENSINMESEIIIPGKKVKKDQAKYFDGLYDRVIKVDSEGFLKDFDFTLDPRVKKELENFMKNGDVSKYNYERLKPYKENENYNLCRLLCLITNGTVITDFEWLKSFIEIA